MQRVPRGPCRPPQAGGVSVWPPGGEEQAERGATTAALPAGAEGTGPALTSTGLPAAGAVENI